MTFKNNKYSVKLNYRNIYIDGALVTNISMWYIDHRIIISVRLTKHVIKHNLANIAQPTWIGREFASKFKVQSSNSIKNQFTKILKGKT